MISLSNLSKEADIILNVGSDSVSGAIVDFAKSSPPTVLYSHKSPFPVKEHVSADKLGTHMLAAIHTVIANLHSKHKNKIKNVHVILTSPWFSSFSKTLNIKKETSFTVTHKTIESLVEENLQSILKNISESNLLLLEKTISHVRLNGYETAQPHGQSAKTLDVSVYASTIPPVIKEKIETEIYSTLHPSAAHFHTFPFVAWNVIEKLFAPKENFAFIDVGGEVTDVLVIRNGSINSISSFPIGRNHIVRKIALAQGSEPELASSLINLYASDTVEDTVKDKISSLVSSFGQEWALHFSESIQGVEDSHDHFIPQKAFFVADQDVSKIFSDIMLSQIPNIVSLSRENLSQFVSLAHMEVPNIFIALEAIYIQTVSQSSKLLHD